MKKLFAIAFTCVYLLLTVGVINDTHYCTGRINSSPGSVQAESSSTDLVNRKLDRNSAEFFIINHLYSEAFVVFLA